MMLYRTTGKKLVLLLLVGLLAFLPLQGIVIADEPAAGWLTPGDPSVKFTELPQDYALPFSTIYSWYNADCNKRIFDVIIREATSQQTELRHKSSCAVSTSRGIHDARYLEAGVPAGEFINKVGDMALIPNSDKLVSFHTTVSSVAFDVSLYGAMVPQYNPVTGEVDYSLTGHRYLTDGNGNRISLRPGSVGFSSDGRRIIADSSLGFVRIDLETEQILPFAPGLTYGAGATIVPSVAISPSGRYAAVAVGGTSFKVYDLDNCTDPNMTGQVSCQYKDVRPFLADSLNGYNVSAYIRFASNDLMTFVASYTGPSGENKRAWVRMAPSGQTIEDVNYLALGDSFSSGEGELDDSYYEEGTNEPENKCHLSRRSYPYLAATTLGLSAFHSVACSAARFHPNYGGFSQYDVFPINNSLGDWLPGMKTQQEFIREANASVVTVSMIGNDIGFSGKLARCLAPDSCFHFREDRQSIVNEINGKFDTLVGLYEDIKQKSNNANVYVLGYPQLFSVMGDCRFSVNLDAEEREAAKGLVGYLNAVIEAATLKAGVRYINVENAFEGHYLCGAGQEAVSGLSEGEEILFGTIGNESFHPNDLGHQLFAQELLAQSQMFTMPMPAPDGSVHTPDASSQAYSSFIGDSPSGGRLIRIAYVGKEIARTVVVDNPLNVATDVLYAPDMAFEAWFNSDPTYAGSITTNEHGELNGQIIVPGGLGPGFHTLHLYGKDLANKDIDLYETVYVAASENDFDSDGISNEDEACLFVEPLGIDADIDGVDDACDPEIAEPPSDTTPPEVTGTTDREADYNGWYNGDVNISWEAADIGSSSGAPTQPPAILANLEGIHTYTSEPSCDPLNNCATGSLELKIDKTAPVLGAATWMNNPKSVMGSAAVTLAATDNISGVAEAEYYLGDTDPGNGNGATMLVTEGSVSAGFNTDFPTGVYKVNMRVKDQAGNWSTPLTDYLVVYNPFGTRMTGMRTLLPSLINGDVLPGLIDADQDDKAKFGFNVRYDESGQIHKHSDFQFKYESGSNCRQPAQAVNCHSFELNATSIAWLATQGANDSTGIFQGAAKLEIDGLASNVTFRLTGLDGERLDTASEDYLTLKIYASEANPNNGDPIYQVDAGVLRGNIKIRKW